MTSLLFRTKIIFNADIVDFMLKKADLYFSHPI